MLGESSGTAEPREESDNQFSSLMETGTDLHRRGRFSRAMVFYRKALRAEPDHARAHHLMGLALLGRKRAGDIDRAIEHLLHAVELNEHGAACHNDLGNAYWSKRLVHDATEAFRKAVELDPEFVQPHFNLGNCYWLLERYQEALHEYQSVTRLNDGWAQAHYMTGNCLFYLGRPREAVGCYSAAIDNKDDFVDAHMAKAAALLKIGRWQEGWQCFQKREEHHTLSAFMGSKRAVWEGESIADGTLMIYGEQGIGDVIQFIRFIPEAKSRVSRVVLVCDKRLHALFRQFDCIDELVDKNEFLAGACDIDFDRRVLLMSLPRIFDVTVEDIPGHVPYLRVEPALLEKWRRRLEPDSFNVGIVWAGNPAQKDDHLRSCRLSDLAELADVPGTTLYSLQTDDARLQLKDAGSPRVIDLAEGLTDFNETGAAIAALDLLISVDTASAHLAGALARPVWNLLWSAHCWRYLENRDTTPWYPTMRLFRQHEMGDWQPVVSRVAEELARARLGNQESL